MPLGDPSRAKATLELLETLGQSVPRSLDINRTRRIFVNRNLRMDEIETIGFDMDYTIARYHQAALEKLSVDCTLDKMIARRGYPEEIKQITIDPAFAVRGLVVDRPNGNIAKMDRFGFVGRVYHGSRLLSKEERHTQYRQPQKIRFAHARYAWIDTLFSLPEVVMYAALVDFFDKAGGTLDYSLLWQDIRDCIDEAHRDESMKTVIKAAVADYIVHDPELAATLHKFRSSGKRLFLLTNSALDYTEAVMHYLLDGALPAYPSWRNYFDLVICSAAKPSFFTEQHPFLELDNAGQVRGPATSLQRGRVYQGGNLTDFEKMASVVGDRVLYIGDHIYGDMLRAKKSSVWRTAMILQELEHEVEQIDRLKDRIRRMDKLERQSARLDSEVTYHQLLLKSLQRLDDHATSTDDEGSRATIEAAKIESKRRLDELRGSLRATNEELEQLETDIDRGFNPYWGSIMREGSENSRFGEQVENYACVYTSRVSNFLAYSPLRYFRSPREHMPHESV